MELDIQQLEVKKLEDEELIQECRNLGGGTKYLAELKWRLLFTRRELDRCELDEEVYLRIVDKNIKFPEANLRLKGILCGDYESKKLMLRHQIESYEAVLREID